MTSERGPLELESDCERCCGLCCVAPAFAASPDFGVDKEAGEPCPNLREDFRCRVHLRLREAGFGGCATYECYGAGQQVTQVTFGGRDWRSHPEIAASMFASFMVMRQLHELCMLLSEAAKLVRTGAVRDEVTAALDELEALAQAEPAMLAALDVAARRASVDALLLRVGEVVRGAGVRAEADPHVDGSAPARGKSRT
jgi:hypothetical protein